MKKKKDLMKEAMNLLNSYRKGTPKQTKYEEE